MDSRTAFALFYVFVLAIPGFVLASNSRRWNCPFDSRCGRKQKLRRNEAVVSHLERNMILRPGEEVTENVRGLDSKDIAVADGNDKERK
ncbi:unnamed protein product [Pocillopora meandrina]|uniref:Uncharacterized protein n=1 Tax=Pocillopora meandrina TaxID=46732 RepID=A0AAU9X3U7_9CNID|nr:unnamed protein product [Pocillopora meandrina]